MGITWDSPYGRAYPEWDFIRTGQLCFELDNQYLLGFRRSWKDGKRRKLEELIDDISIGVLAYLEGLRLRTEVRERDRRNWDRQQHRYARAERRKQREAERRKILDELVEISAESAKLRTWLAEVETWPVPVETNEFTRFVAWARERLHILEHAVRSDGIAHTLRERDLFPETDALTDPPEDLVEE